MMVVSHEMDSPESRESRHLMDRNIVGTPPKTTFWSASFNGPLFLSKFLPLSSFGCLNPAS